MKARRLGFTLAAMLGGTFALAVASTSGVVVFTTGLGLGLLWLVACVAYLAVASHRAARRYTRPARCTPSVRSARRVGGRR